MNALSNNILNLTYERAPESRPLHALYDSLLRGFSTRKGSCGRSDAGQFLQAQIRQIPSHDTEFPASLREIDAWLFDTFTDTGHQYRQYLKDRRAGAAPRYFSCRSHALDFLRKSAPTKLVDGSWLYGILPQWRDRRFGSLIRTYLEELGDGVRAQNHVALYKELLADNDCNDWAELDDDYFQQGAIQLALAARAEDFLPEIIGFNLGYEQMPLHLPITAYELGEHGIDPYYFTLHITIDNFHNGHAKHALTAVKRIAPLFRDQQEFFSRMKNGYLLNSMGMGAAAIVDSFDLDREVTDMLTRKALIGQYLHCDRCRIQGTTINEWLAKPGGMPEFLQALESSGWIKRNQDPAESRFWQLIDGEKPLMFGVFDAREKQLVSDWISGSWKARRVSPAQRRGERNESAQNRTTAASRVDTDASQPASILDGMIAEMSPALHDTETGLHATRAFAAHFYHYCQSSIPTLLET